MSRPFEDPLMPSRALLPMSTTRSGGQIPLVHEPNGRTRPYSATLAVPPLEMGKHDTAATEWTETDETERSDDGNVFTDSVEVTKTDT